MFICERSLWYETDGVPDEKKEEILSVRNRQNNDKINKFFLIIIYNRENKHNSTDSSDI